jgi:peroxiredoxin
VQTATQKALSFPVVSDVGNVVARQYGLVYRVEPRVVDTLRAIGIDLAAINGDGSGELPLTATFVIDPAGVVRWATVDADFRRRPDAAEIVAALAALPTGAVR